MDERIAAVITAAQRVLDAVEFDEDRAMMYIRMPGTEYGFDMSEKIKNPLAEAILLLSAQMDALEIAQGTKPTPAAWPTDEWYREQKAQLSPDEFKRLYYGEWVKSDDDQHTADQQAR